jgi:hypothetical protein
MRRQTISQLITTHFITGGFNLMPFWKLVVAALGDSVEVLLDAIEIGHIGRLIRYQWSGIGSQHLAPQ